MNKFSSFDAKYEEGGISFLDTINSNKTVTIGENKIIKIWIDKLSESKQISEYDLNKKILEILDFDISLNGKVLVISGKDYDNNGILVSLEVDAIDQMIDKACEWLKDYHSISKSGMKSDSKNICISRLNP